MAAAALLAAAAPARALDIFTLWRQPMIPLHMTVGAWADYRSVTQEAGRNDEELIRIQCVGATAGAWLVEMLPLRETKGELTPLAGEGWSLRLSQRLLRREGQLGDHVERVVRWRGGIPTELAPAEWRDDPLVASSLRADFQPRRSEVAGSTVRVIGRRELLCDQFEFSAADTVLVDLPRGRLLQVASREISAAVSAEIPFLGLAYASERNTAAAHIDPPDPRRRLPPPSVQIQIMELVGFGNGARAALGPAR